MRILHVISSMDPEGGGASQGIRNSIPAQEKFGVQSEVLCFDAPDSVFLQAEPLQVNALGPARGPYAYCSGLTTWLNENLMRFDVVVINGLWQYNSYGTYRVWKHFKARKGKHPKLYVMPHGMLDPYFQKAKSRRLKAVRNWFFWKLIEYQVINGADGILFTCEQELLLARETFNPYHPKAEINIGYGIELPPRADARSTQDFLSKCPEVINQPYLLFLSRIHPKKGVDILIRAYLKLRAEMDGIPDLVIAGPGLDTSYGKEMQEIGKDKSIHFPGMLKGPAKWGAFYGCNAFVLPSHQENFGIAVVEAMACGKPVLISNQVNIFQEIKKAQGGLICENTEHGVYSMLKYWIKETEDKQREMGRNALGVFEQHFAIEQAATRMIACFQEKYISPAPCPSK